jgi:hypothetical protein
MEEQDYFLVSLLLAQADVLRRHFDQFILVDVFDGLFQGETPGRNQRRASSLRKPACWSLLFLVI